MMEEWKNGRMENWDNGGLKGSEKKGR